jgi:hypothetical protein
MTEWMATSRICARDVSAGGRQTRRRRTMERVDASGRRSVVSERRETDVLRAIGPHVV